MLRLGHDVLLVGSPPGCAASTRRRSTEGDLDRLRKSVAAARPDWRDDGSALKWNHDTTNRSRSRASRDARFRLPLRASTWRMPPLSRVVRCGSAKRCGQRACFRPNSGGPAVRDAASGRVSRPTMRQFRARAAPAQELPNPNFPFPRMTSAIATFQSFGNRHPPTPGIPVQPVNLSTLTSTRSPWRAPRHRRQRASE